MKIIRAKVLGFCMGVRRAVDLALAEAAAAQGTGHAVFTAGPLIHNPVVLKDLEARGVKILDEADIKDLSGDVVIIRAHGIGPETEKELAGRGARIADATCPKVKASQMKARALARAGYRIFLAGEEHHGEIAGLQGYIAASCAEAALDGTAVAGDAPGRQGIVAANAAEAEIKAEKLFSGAPLSKTALIAQTTISPGEYEAIGEAIKKFFPDLEIVNTICGATEDRQKALRDLLENVDAIVVAGGRESSNTRRLLAIAQASGKPAVLAETAADISCALTAALPAEFKSYAAWGRLTIGLCAGASTPDDVINSIETALKNLYITNRE
ncbi:MAG: 4-hydroxy-3-methylbut-2-enyl diphosphate reductase [Treponema sp.]|jgi:4-hydroxy-3-methylbut-2-enyl diphosphate reductase|nr:4-hydroxy-3-methylbut-2-enyl diphosphate reductase [Treponema sp.]